MNDIKSKKYYYTLIYSYKMLKNISTKKPILISNGKIYLKKSLESGKNKNIIDVINGGSILQMKPNKNLPIKFDLSINKKK